MQPATLFPSGAGGKLSRNQTYGRAAQRPAIFRFWFWRERICGQRGYLMMEENKQDWADEVGKQVSTVLIALLAALFVYGYLGWLV
jgi:hypothetical protein